jgi:hypothetical protein
MVSMAAFEPDGRETLEEAARAAISDHSSQPWSAAT